MSDYLFILKNDLFIIANKLIEKNLINQSFNLSNISIDYQSKSKKGDVSTNLFILLNKNINDKNFNINIFVQNELDDLKYISKAEISQSGFINIFFDKKFLKENLNKILENNNTYGNNNSGKNKTINVEFVSANPTGPLHVAHMRGAIFGDVISNMLESQSYKVTREYYVNDSGSQILTLGESLYKRYLQILGKQISISDKDYPGEYLIDIAKLIYNLDKDKWLNSNLEKRTKYFKDFAIKEIIKTIEKDLKGVNIKFDVFTYESNIIQNKIIEKVFNILKKKDLLYEGFLKQPKGEENKDWKPRKQLLFRSTNFNDDNDRPFQKDNGEWTYFANDAAYHFDKFNRNYTNLINVWGSDHIGYIKRMKSIVEVVSNNKDYLNICICQIVRLIKNDQIMKMSKREGNFVTVNDLINEVGKDPLRYFMISTKNETPMDFNIDKVISKNKDNPVFYCQYAYARASSVINKSKSNKEFNNFSNLLSNFDHTLITPFEWEIILKVLSWPYLLNQSAELKQPHKITNYLEDLCSHFHSLWNKGKDNETFRFIDSSNINQTSTRLIWIECFRVVLKRAFTIIGIDAPEQM